MKSLKVKNDHCSLAANLSNWKEEAWKIQGFSNLTVMIILHFHPQPQFKYELFHIFFMCNEKFVSQIIGFCLFFFFYWGQDGIFNSAVKLFNVFKSYKAYLWFRTLTTHVTAFLCPTKSIFIFHPSRSRIFATGPPLFMACADTT